MRQVHFLVEYESDQMLVVNHLPIVERKEDVTLHDDALPLTPPAGQMRRLRVEFEIACRSIGPHVVHEVFRSHSFAPDSTSVLLHSWVVSSTLRCSRRSPFRNPDTCT